MSLPPYVSRYRHGTQVYDPPCLTSQATMYCFAVKADPDRMKAATDAFLNVPAKGQVHFEPVGDTVLFFFLRAPSLRSANATYPSGYVPDYESAPSMPLLMRYQDDDGKPKADLVNFMPYVLINNVLGCIAGREIFGFLKGLGQFEVPLPTEPLDKWEVKAEVFDQLTPSTEIRWAPLYTVRRTSGGDRPVEDLIEAADDFLEVIKSLLLDWSPGLLSEVGIDLIQAILTRSFPVVNLRQFPDIEDAQKACFQEICTAPMTITALRGGGRLKGEFELDVPSYGSHDVAGDLGLPGAGPTYPVEFGLYIDFDFTVPAGKRIWKA